jgi:hypothetical protein
VFFDCVQNAPATEQDLQRSTGNGIDGARAVKIQLIGPDCAANAMRCVHAFFTSISRLPRANTARIEENRIGKIKLDESFRQG